jgi:hypothetical protein
MNDGSSVMKNSIELEQLRRNALSADCWQLYAGHRRSVMELLTGVPIVSSTPALCVLGAGNSNDLDLRQLVTRFSNLHLVDLDGDSLDRGVARQNLDSAAGIHVHGGVDLTGLIGLMDSWKSLGSASEQQVRQCLQQPVSPSPASLVGLAGGMDVVASVCMLSQLIDSVVSVLGRTHPCFLDMVLSLRREHLRLMLDLLCDGGQGVLITDFVSSDTCPELAHVPPAQLVSLCIELIRRDNFFTGLNPFAIANSLRQDPLFQGRIGDVELSPPWCWRYVTRTYAVAAVLFSKRKN